MSETDTPTPPPATDADPHPWARRLGVLLTIATFLLIVTGGIVTSEKAGLAVPDWPGSFGYWIFLPTKIWGDMAVMLEHNHRLTAQTAGLICIATSLPWFDPKVGNRVWSC
jgi:cytochrome c oxidase assembly protein subunit 15